MSRHSFSGAVRRYFSANDPVRVFVPVVAVGMVMYFLLCVIFGEGRFTSIFFSEGNDLFMDFFNSIRDASQGSAVYTERHVIYPPMANLLFLIFSRFTPSYYNSSSFEHRKLWIHYPSAIILIILFTMIIAVLLAFLIATQVRRGRMLNGAFAFFAIFSVPVLYTFERGNILSLCLLSLLVYAATYHSEKKCYREIGLLALAFAFSLKLYPAVFGYFLLCDKRYKETIRCCVYALLMLILPSFFFGGPACLITLFRNTFSFSSSGGSGIVAVLGYLRIPEWVFRVLSRLWILICAGAFLLAPFSGAARWKCWLMGLLTILVVPSLTTVYSWAFLLIPLLLLYKEYAPDENGRYGYTRRDWFYFWVILIPFFALPFRWFSAITINGLAVYLCTAVMSVYAVIDILTSWLRKRREKKAEIVRF